jgi:hypothetical protein
MMGSGTMGPGMMDAGSGMMGPGMMSPDSGMMGSAMMGADSGAMGPGMMNMMAAGDHCPMSVPGTKVKASDVSGGMSMMFATTGDVGELRKKVHAMADHMNAQASGAMGAHSMMMGSADGGPGMMQGRGMGPSMHSGTMTPLPPGRAQAEDADGGARLRMMPADPSRLGEMKERIQQHVQMMNQDHSCSTTGLTN